MRCFGIVPEEGRGGLPDGFATTQWSLVLAAQVAPVRRDALERLCRVYWLPVFVYVRRRGFDRPDAEDLTQSFFVDILQRDWLSHADPQRGSFRGFLRASVHRFVQRTRRAARAKKRGGGRAFFEMGKIEQAEAEVLAGPAEMNPDDAFDREWAHTVLRRALERLREEQPDARRQALFDACQPYLLGSAESGAYDRIARRFEITRGTVAVTVHRLGKRYRELVRAEVADTVARPESIEEELRHLLQAVSR